MPADPVQEYLKEIQKHLSAGIATEHTYRSALGHLLESFAKGVTATNEPKRVQCGAPDFIVTRGQTPLGYVEAKDIGKNLDEVEKTEQMDRYREGLSNLILTDYLEFRWYRNGEFAESARLARVGKNGRLEKSRDAETELRKVMEPFFSSTLPTVRSPRELADRMAALARILRDVIVRAFENEDAKTGALHEQLAAFRRVLLHDLEPAPFADMYAQTICYGMFAACCNHKPGRGAFTREAAAFDLPETNPFLREMFTYIAGPKLDSRLTWAVDHLTELLRHADMAEIQRDFGRRTRQQDPVVHFYETFLAAYDPKMREARGVYYTPEPVVSYIVRSVDHILKKDFKIAAGLASDGKYPLYKKVEDPERGTRLEKTSETHRVLILDPAAGTGTFLHGVVDQIHQHIMDSGMRGVWDTYVSEHLLPRLFGFELLMAPYAVAHMKLGIQLAETGYTFHSGERLRVYLTNTLEEAFEHKDLPLFANLIAEEANAAGRIKNEAPVMVVLGNPPYSGHSENKSAWIADLLHGRGKAAGKSTGDYFKVDGKPLGERNPKWLNDDYVKFIRFAQWRIENTSYGILAFICNNGYLDNPTFRGMRQSLMETFDDIYILNLHGSSKKKEIAPNGSKDENVFDIQQGVAIGIFVRRMSLADKRAATVRHAELWGPREVREKRRDGATDLVGGKYHELLKRNVATTRWKTLQPDSPFYLFVPLDPKLRREYEGARKVTDFMLVNVLGFQTHRDGFAIDFDENILEKRISEMRGQKMSDSEYADEYGLKESGGWTLASARRKLRQMRNWRRPIIRCSYRPFDQRFCYFSDIAMDRPRRELLDHVVKKENLCINLVRQTKSRYWAHVMVSDRPAPAVYIEVKDGSNVFPLYLYPKPIAEAEDMIEAWEAANGETRERKPNLAPGFIEDLSNRLGITFTCSAGVPPAKSESTAGVPPIEANAGKMPALQFEPPEGDSLEIRSRGHLPHWTADNATYFVTFRLTDSLPKAVLEVYASERERILKNAERMRRDLTESEKHRLAELYSEKIEAYLDSGAGACHMRNPGIARIVADALRHFDGSRYRLFTWCVMPNHVHALFRIVPGEQLDQILHSWKSYTAKLANVRLGRQGAFWQREYYDHLIRDSQDFENHRRYILENPEKAGLRNWEWVDGSAGVPPALSNNSAGVPPSEENAGKAMAQNAGKAMAQNAGKMPALQKDTFGPEDVFHYMYAVFHSPAYRARYAPFLKIDFPRLPLTSRLPLFRALCGLGERLKDLHLMEADIKPITTFPKTGDSTVENPRFVEEDTVGGGCATIGKVYINKTQYFGGVPRRAWEFHVGGYQVCQKWLKDRKGRPLSYDDLTHYQRIVAALDETSDLMAEIDAVIAQHGGWPIQ